MIIVQAQSTVWDFFPRFLSEKEFKNPYRVFRKFFQRFSLPQWRDQLYELVYYSLISDGTDTAGFEIDYPDVYLMLQKLVEPSHLIQVHENLKNQKIRTDHLSK